MLTFKEFCESMHGVMKEVMRDEYAGYEIELYETNKNNGVEKCGISVKHNERPLGVVIYLEEFYDRYLEEKCDMEELVEIFSNVLDKGLQDVPTITKEDVYDFDKAKDRITMKLINYKDNKDLLSQVPHKVVDDLAVIYQLEVSMKDATLGKATMLIRNEIQDFYGLTVDELHDLAMKNAKELDPPALLGLSVPDVLLRNAENLFESGKVNTENPMFVLTNTSRHCGASMVLYPEVLEKARDIIGEDFYLLPSSIHEQILVPKSYLEPQHLGSMVREINAAEVAREEILSDHVYEFDFEQKQLQSVKESMVKQKEKEMER